MSRTLHNWIAPSGSAVFHSAAPEIAGRYLHDEAAAVEELCNRAQNDDVTTQHILRDARALASAMRELASEQGGLDSFLVEYDLSSHEGVVLMCLAESLLRIPDAETADRLIADKLGDADFHEHLGKTDDLLVNVGTWGLILSGRIVGEDRTDASPLNAIWNQMLTRIGEPIIRNGLRAAMRIMSEQFVMGQTIEQALERAATQTKYEYSFDMLGEAALTSAAADDYFEKYAYAITAIARERDAGAFAEEAPSISIKLSALSPRYEFAHVDALKDALVPRLKSLVSLALESGVPVTIDAEEADRLEPSLLAFEAVYRSLAPQTDGQFGLAVQAYQKRGIAVVQWLQQLASGLHARIPVRLVKGAYWDTEIKLAQIRGLAGFPVFTRKSSTDVAYLACARSMLAASGYLYSQFATHNPHTVAWILHEGARADFEFQRLHGMGEELYESVATISEALRPCRVYAPVGTHQDLLPYLVRRLLENGANTSFVNRFVNAEIDVTDLIHDPVEQTRALHSGIANPRIRLPSELFGGVRQNSFGVNLTDPSAISSFAAQLESVATLSAEAAPVVAGHVCDGDRFAVRDPGNRDSVVGVARMATPDTMKLALDEAYTAFPAWNATAAPERAEILRSAAQLLEQARAELVSICVAEGGRTVVDALAEIREAVDFLRYYAHEAEKLCSASQQLPGPTGESNALRMSGRGVFVCISPWNFPVAIFTGQIAAALATGNTVIAKPAEQTPLAAAKIVNLLIDAGIPVGALQFLPGAGRLVGETLLPDPRVAGVAFTGSTETAKTIERTLAEREGPIATLIAETGGINAMIVDSSALAEQVVKDAAVSAFNSAGQRCSALRLLCVQNDVAEEITAMLIGRMNELVIGDPSELSTDVGPVIDPDAVKMLQEYVESRRDRVLFNCRLNQSHDAGCYFPPCLVRLSKVSELTREVFGPVLHIVRFDAGEISSLVDDLNAVGYGLTLGVQSRVASVARYVEEHARVGNIYINRDMIGAVVGVQPFGGLGLSGTGPKAGGPHYLQRFTVEQTITVNTAAVGGNVDLLAEDAD